MTVLASKSRRLVHFTPLRYPGGKRKLAAYLKEVIAANKLFDGEYIEPYAGGAAIGLELLFQEYVTMIHINDLSQPIYSFWKAVLNDTEELCRLIKDTERSVESWDRQKLIFSNPNDHSYVQLGFATFFLNRTNRSGILNGGIIGGRAQTGPWKIDARYNADELIFRVQSIANLRRRIKLTRRDALDLLRHGMPKWPEKTIVYLDPPYYERGRDLYYDYYRDGDHVELAKFIHAEMNSRSWIISYDNVSAIKDLYAGFRRVVYNVSYSARGSRQGTEVMFFSPGMIAPDMVGPVQQIGPISEAA